MAASARFGRLERAPAPTSLDWDGVDLRPPVAYQMVPKGATRPGAVAVAGGPVSVTSLDPGVVKISVPPMPFAPQASFSFDPGLGRQQGFGFTFHGLAEGRAIVGAFAPDSTLLHAIVVSVKKPRRVTYNLHILRDAIRPKSTKGPPERTLAELGAMLKSVEKTYLDQANVVLVKGRENILTMEMNLDDPFDPTAPSLFGGNNHHELITGKLKDGNFISLDLVGLATNMNVVSTWNIKDESDTRLVQGLTDRRLGISYVERIDGGIMETANMAHEMGHALGLGHNAVVGSMMLEASGGAPSFQLLREEIDFINQSAGRRGPLPV